VCVEVIHQDEVECEHFVTNADKSCPSGILTRFSTVEKGIGGGVVAAIVVGSAAGAVAVAVGGKKTYDYWKFKDIEMSAVQNNPFYEKKGDSIDNPLFDQDNSHGNFKDEL